MFWFVYKKNVKTKGESGLSLCLSAFLSVCLRFSSSIQRRYSDTEEYGKELPGSAGRAMLPGTSFELF